MLPLSLPLLAFVTLGSAHADVILAPSPKQPPKHYREFECNLQYAADTGGSVCGDSPMHITVTYSMDREPQPEMATLRYTVEDPVLDYLFPDHSEPLVHHLGLYRLFLLDKKARRFHRSAVLLSTFNGQEMIRLCKAAPKKKLPSHSEGDL